jgi:hypothetical protein
MENMGAITKKSVIFVFVITYPTTGKRLGNQMGIDDKDDTYE